MSEPSEAAKRRAREIIGEWLPDVDPDSPIFGERALLRDLIASELTAKDAEIEELKRELSLPRRSRSKKQKIEDALRESDLTAQLSGRDDISYGHHETLPRGEHVARLKVASKES